MITDFFVGLFGDLTLWFLGIFGEYEPLPAAVTDALDGIGGFFASTGAFLGALDQWFPVAAFLGVATAALVVEVALSFIRGVRQVKQLLPFQ